VAAHAFTVTATLITLPALVVALLAQRHMISGLTLVAVKQ
jgi:ABC-type maltose transport system permease subunit